MYNPLVDALRRSKRKHNTPAVNNEYVGGGGGGVGNIATAAAIAEAEQLVQSARETPGGTVS